MYTFKYKSQSRLKLIDFWSRKWIYFRKSVEVGLGKSKYARIEPRNLNEKLAMESVLRDPLTGSKQLPIPMTDSRWTASEDWVKMAKNVNGIEIHFVFNKITKKFDDFKFK